MPAVASSAPPRRWYTCPSCSVCGVFSLVGQGPFLTGDGGNSLSFLRCLDLNDFNFVRVSGVLCHSQTFSLAICYSFMGPCLSNYPLPYRYLTHYNDRCRNLQKTLSFVFIWLFFSFKYVLTLIVLFSPKLHNTKK